MRSLRLWPVLVAIAAWSGCMVDVSDLGGRACDDSHPCSDGRVCFVQKCVDPASIPSDGDGDASIAADGGGSFDDGGDVTDAGADGGTPDAGPTDSGVPGFIASPTGSLVSGTPVTLDWDPSRGDTIVGLPHTTVISRPGTAGFEDISMTGTKVVFPSENDDDFAPIPVDFSTWLFGQKVGPQLIVSTNGYLVFGPYTNPDNFDAFPLPSAAADAFMVAPYWADLDAVDPGAGVYWTLEGAGTSDPVLVVQWNNDKELNSNEGGVTFEAHIHSTGQLDFDYLYLPMAPHKHTVGAQGPDARWAVAATAAPNSGLTLFGPQQRPAVVPVIVPGTLSGAIPTDGGFDRLSIDFPSVVRPGDLTVTEAMAAPAAPFSTTGEWLELSNATATPVDLSNWTLTLSGARTFPLGGTVPAYGTLVLGQSVDPAQNADAGVTQVIPGLSLKDSNETAALGRMVALPVQDFNGGAGAGVATVLAPGPYLGRNGAAWPVGVTCGAKTPWSTASSELGSPGVQTTCGFDYVLQSIPGSFYEIAPSGTRVFNASVTSQVAAVNLPSPAPTLFGNPTSTLYVSTNGWLSPTATANGADTNKTAPDANSPLGTIAVYWDNLIPGANRPVPSDVYWKRVAANEDPRNPAPHWIFEWHSFAYDDPQSAKDDLNFEVKLFDDGVIEFHYGKMFATWYQHLASGNTATVWLEDPTGTYALPITVNAPAIWPNTAYRFTPK